MKLAILKMPLLTPSLGLLEKDSVVNFDALSNEFKKDQKKYSHHFEIVDIYEPKWGETFWAVESLFPDIVITKRTKGFWSFLDNGYILAFKEESQARSFANIAREPLLITLDSLNKESVLEAKKRDRESKINGEDNNENDESSHPSKKKKRRREEEDWLL